MKAGGQTAGVGVCLLLGVGDLVVLNTVLVPDYVQTQTKELTVVTAPRPVELAQAAARGDAKAPAPQRPVQAPQHPVQAAQPAVKESPAPVPAPKPQAPAEPVPAPKPAPEAAAKQSSRSWLLQFSHNKDVLTRRTRRTLAEVVKAAQPGLRVVVEGHSNDIGPADYNRALSRRRAEAVVSWLMRHGVGKEVVVVRWHGEDKPKLVKKTRTARSLNRRVEVSVEEQ